MALTSLPLGRERFGVAAREELSPTPGRELGLGDRDLGESCFLCLGEGVSPSLVQSLSLVSRGEGARVERKEREPSWGVRTATMSVWAEERGGERFRRGNSVIRMKQGV